MVRSRVRRRPGINVRRVEKPIYTVDEVKLRRYDQRRLIFNRVSMDPSFIAYNRSEEEQGLRNIAERKLGYTRVDYALSEAAWTAHDAWTDAFDAERLERTFGPSLMGTKWYGEKHRVDDPAEMTSQVKKAARFYGADLVGVTEFNPMWIQANARRTLEPLELPEGVRYAVVMAVALDELGVATSPEVPAGAATGLGYSKMAFIAGTLAEFVRNLGYTAVSSGNDIGLSVPLAVDAGLGQVGRNGLLITPEYGPRVKICKVFTDLPLIPDEPVEFGVTQYCMGCERCAEECEVEAIQKGPPLWEPACASSSPGALKWYVDGEKCFEYWCDNGADCSTCVSVCPYNRGRRRRATDEEFWQSY
jgi:epoxyqueuosine reductase